MNPFGLVSLGGRVAVVTAGSRGLGSAIARQLAQWGADVAITYVSDGAAAEATAKSIRDLGRRCVAIQANAGNFDEAHQALDRVLKECGGIHILICNAAAARSKAIWKLTEADWDDVIETSLKGAFNYIHAAAPVFMSQQYGKIVCVGSINGLRGRVGTASYNTAKAGLAGLIKTAAAELGRFNVNVNLVAPGFIETPSQVNTPELIRSVVLNECAIKRLGTPEDIAPVIAFLCSEAARHITGQVIKADAGQYI